MRSNRLIDPEGVCSPHRSKGTRRHQRAAPGSHQYCASQKFPRCVLQALVGITSAILVALMLVSCQRASAPFSTSNRASPLPSPDSAIVPLAPDVDYHDLSEHAGLRYSWSNHPPGPWTILETAGAGCAFLDYDGDGWMDIFLAGSPRCALYHNNHDGTFTDVTAKAGITQQGHWIGVAVGDYDNDGREDIYVSGYHCGMLLRNNGNGTFTNVTHKAGLEEEGWSTCAAFVDTDNDGRLDLLVGHYVNFNKNDPQLCDYALGVRAGCGPQVYTAEMPLLYHNNGNGTFTDVTASSGLNSAHGKDLALRIWDYDNDGKPDIYLANDHEPGDLFHNTGHGHFQNVGSASGAAYGLDGSASAGMGADCADYDRDGRLDLAVSTFSGETFELYHNTPSGFTLDSMKAGMGATRRFLGWGCHFLDFNDDGWPDLVFATGHIHSNAEAADPGSTFRQKPMLFRNDHGRFTLVPNPGSGLSTPRVGRGLAVGDVENDGSQDILMVDFDGGPLLLHNQRRSHNHWLGVKLIGTRCNRDAYGARVSVRWAGGQAFQDCNPAGSYASSMDPRLHFGLGANASNLSVEVRWPNGSHSQLSHAAPDHYITVRQ